ncbi:hypothetical protein M153_210004122 [Pseudoloma neurophilia]|uniref:GIT Spa2 homology (SHD) domain-containing protein n=1 Tax=Pseudoloma neurophilia TaxID=146866 RepID=A0A0R0M509_9MICR|nr:hypothetical protein M153_210004122 [Pseudoloma neurophilia]
MMDIDEDESEILRYTLYGYIGTKLQNLNIKSRQKRAYAKLSFLNDVQFKNLVKDIKFEINRRVLGLKSSEIENKKLAALVESKFKDLVIDVFFVFNKRMPSKKYENTEEPELLLFNFESLIESLKSDNEVILSKLRSDESIFDKFEHYQQFVKNLVDKNVENELVEKHMTIINEMSNLFQKKDLLLMEILRNSDTMRTIAENLLQDNPYYQKIRNRVNILDTVDINEKNRTILDVLELLLFKNSYNDEVEETIDLLTDCHSSRTVMTARSSPNIDFSQKDASSTSENQNYNSEFLKKMKSLIKGIRRHAERINDTENIQILDQLLDESIDIQKEEKILKLANILKEIILKERNCNLEV